MLHQARNKQYASLPEIIFRCFWVFFKGMAKVDNCECQIEGGLAKGLVACSKVVGRRQKTLESSASCKT